MSNLYEQLNQLSLSDTEKAIVFLQKRLATISQKFIIAKDGLYLDTSNRICMVHDQVVDLTRIEFKLLHYLMARPGRICTREQLLNHVWGTYDVSDRTVDTAICRLRRKLKSAGHFIKTEKDLGYRLCA